ncbi:M66 family metalloprotease [Mesoterricola sediminis]|uniref:Uncharacterized protein n=1 Tax=Mesoterricola sediminis TaxID=2927980 RepID=A0AA48KCY4_9BACT|nr:M66 family metalloprotease [Mesoterricola sediminis]BDU76520.1 hypothetical protein METESE_14780 [Mesoterricola sediminis]
MALTALPGSARTTLLSLGGGLLALALACGGGGKSAPHLTVSVTPASGLTLPVPYDYSSQGFYMPPYAGTATVAIARDSSVTGAVTLSVTGLPTNCKAQFSAPTTSGTSSVLSIQAGYPDPSDPTFVKQVYPKAGTYTLTVTAKASGQPDATATLPLKLGSEAPAFDLAFVDATASRLDTTPDITLAGTAPVTKYLLAYYTTSQGWSASGPVTVTMDGVPSGLTVSTGTATFSLQDSAPHPLTIAAQPGLAAGTYAFSITASFNGVASTLPVVVTYAPYPFYVQPQIHAEGPSVVQGGRVAFPLYLGRNDTFFTTVSTSNGTEGVYAGDVLLSASGMPSGLTVTFGDGDALNDPKGLQSVPLVIQAAATVPAGTYPVTLQATRSTPGAVTAAAPVTLPVTVTASAAGTAPVFWIQNVEWGQTVLKPGLPLVAGKPALLRVQYLADRPGQTGALAAKLQDGTVLALRGPAAVPTEAVEGDLPTAAAASASTYTCLLPAAAVQSGLSVTLQGTGAPALTVTPTVRAGMDYALVVLPVVHKGVAPALPSDAALTQGLLAIWPFSGVPLSHRAAYTTSTAIPEPTTDPTKDHSGDAWGQILNEVASLRVVDGGSAPYYGFLAPGYTFGTQPSGYTLGVTLASSMASIGTDASLDTVFGNQVPNQTVAVETLVHETGHILGLLHTPAGTFPVDDEVTNYPYFGGLVGTWGYDVFTQTPLDPAGYYDIMSYSSESDWVSDWCYLHAMGWVSGQKKVGTRLASTGVRKERLVVSGTVTPDGQVRLQPLVRAQAEALPPRAGAYTLALQASSGRREVAFAAEPIPGLPGHAMFLFTVDADEELVAADVRREDRSLARREARVGRGMRAAALDRAEAAGTLEVREASGTLHLAWDPVAHPYVDVVHEGTAGTTTLALHLTGGTADLPLAGLPEGGRFQVRYSDGLNAVSRARARDEVRDRTR